MKNGMIAAVAGLAVSGVASATFTSYVVTSANVTSGAQNLVVYNVFARFNGPTDTLLNCFNLGAAAGSGTSLTGFWHKDNASGNSGTLGQEFGTWNPSQTGSITLNRPFDSYLTIGGLAAPTNATNADPSWGNPDSWNRPDVPNGANAGWFNSNPPSNAGRVGINNNLADSVRLGQFVMDRDAAGTTWNLKIGYNSGVAGAPVQFAEATFVLGLPVPAPGAIALLGLAGLAGRRRR